MEEPLPWLCQGDVFRDVPILDVDLAGRSDLRPRLRQGPAVLLSHGCAIDKRRRNGDLQVERMQFASLRLVTELPNDRQGSLRAKAQEIAPFEVMYLGALEHIGEVYLTLSDPYYLPASYFELSVENYAEHPSADQSDPTHVRAAINDDRIARLDESQIELLHQKIIAFWTRSHAETV